MNYIVGSAWNSWNDESNEHEMLKVLLQDMGWCRLKNKIQGGFHGRELKNAQSLAYIINLLVLY